MPKLLRHGEIWWIRQKKQACILRKCSELAQLPQQPHASQDKLCDKYLPGQKRRVIKIKQVGNCFYSALSFQLFGSQDEDIAVRNVIQ